MDRLLWKINLRKSIINKVVGLIVNEICQIQLQLWISKYKLENWTHFDLLPFIHLFFSMRQIPSSVLHLNYCSDGLIWLDVVQVEDSRSPDSFRSSSKWSNISNCLLPTSCCEILCHPFLKLLSLFLRNA